jgi:predicted oxidoreductase
MLPIVGSGKIDRLKKAVNAQTLSISREQWYQIYNASRGYELP